MDFSMLKWYNILSNYYFLEAKKTIEETLFKKDCDLNCKSRIIQRLLLENKRKGGNNL